MPKIYPVVLSGGSGTRLWPKSRQHYPKQFHRLTTKDSLVQEALLRVRDPEVFGKTIIVCNNDHRFMCEEQAKEVGIELQDIVLEPEGRNTAPAVALAAVIVQEIDPEGICLVLASDHHIADTEAFLKAVQTGTEAAAGGSICTFGIKPSCPETGYGYIKASQSEVKPGVFQIDSFKEKPDLATAKKYVADPAYLWNSGMFMFSAARMIEELQTYQPTIVPACQQAVIHAKRDLCFLRVDREHFRNAKAISLDYAVMEPTKFAAVIPLDAQWTDVGSWVSLYQTCLGKSTNEEEKKLGNYTVGNVHTEDTTDTYISSDGPLVTTIGVKDLCVIATNDAVLVLPMNRSQDVGALAKKLAKNQDTKSYAQNHVSEYKPWGSMTSSAKGTNFKVHTLTINPGGKVSYQMHMHRAEHWIVVQGTALVTKGTEQVLLKENQSTFIPLGMKHRLANPGKVPLVVIEVQSGHHILKEDTIRFNDEYGRELHTLDVEEGADVKSPKLQSPPRSPASSAQRATARATAEPATVPMRQLQPMPVHMPPPPPNGPLNALFTGLGVGIGLGVVAMALKFVQKL